MNQTGTFIIAANAIGNPADIPARSLEAVRTADLLIFEEDRPARQILKAAGVHREYVRYSEHRESLAEDDLVKCLKAGGTALYMSDQGVPGLADPGRGLIAIAREQGATLRVIPGPSSVTAAIAACPFDMSAFHYAGFLPRESEHRLSALKKLATDNRPTILLDTPYRLAKVLRDVHGASPAMQVFLAMDISGEHERYELGTAKALLGRLDSWPPKLNFVMILNPKS